MIQLNMALSVGAGPSYGVGAHTWWAGDIPPDVLPESDQSAIIDCFVDYGIPIGASHPDFYQMMADARHDGRRLNFWTFYLLRYNFSGFSAPVDNLPTLNNVKAGSAVPVKFSLSGDQGLDIFAAGYPKVQAIPCDSSAPADAIEETVTTGSSGLSYDAMSDTYTYVWKSQKNWAGTCRQLTVRLDDGTDHTALFQFK